MRKFVIAAALLTGMAAPTVAQQTNAPAAANTRGATAPTAPATEPSPGQMAAAMDLLDANRSTANIAAILDTLAPIETQQIRREHPGIDPATLDALQKAIRDEFVAREDDYKRMVAAVYAEHFSEEELRKLAAFYRSDVGKKYIDAVPTLLKEMGPVGASWGAAVAMEAVRKFLKVRENLGQHA
jgi:hypothetical protein